MPAPQVTIDLADYDKLRNDRQAALEEAAKSREAIVQAKLGDEGSETRKAVAVARAAIEVVRYAMGNLSPEFAKKWPYQHLAALADGIIALPDVSIDDGNLALEMHSFAKDCETWERTRATKTMADEATRIEKANLTRIAEAAGNVKTKAQTEGDDGDRNGGMYPKH